jgi:hypothetical protein
VAPAVAFSLKRGVGTITPSPLPPHIFTFHYNRTPSAIPSSPLYPLTPIDEHLMRCRFDVVVRAGVSSSCRCAACRGLHSLPFLSSSHISFTNTTNLLSPSLLSHHNVNSDVAVRLRSCVPPTDACVRTCTVSSQPLHSLTRSAVYYFAFSFPSTLPL